MFSLNNGAPGRSPNAASVRPPGLHPAGDPESLRFPLATKDQPERPVVTRIGRG